MLCYTAGYPVGSILVPRLSEVQVFVGYSYHVVPVPLTLSGQFDHLGIEDFRCLLLFGQCFYSLQFIYLFKDSNV